MTPTLSPRQTEITKLIALGFSNKEIGCELKIAERTVVNHIVVIFARLRARNRAQAACIFQRAMRKAQNHENTGTARRPNAVRVRRPAKASSDNTSATRACSER